MCVCSCIYSPVQLSILLLHPTVYTLCSVGDSFGLFHPAKRGDKDCGGFRLSLWVFKIYSSKCNFFPLSLAFPPEFL